MEQLDRLGWAAGLAIRAYGVRVGIRANDPNVLKRIEPYLPPGWRPASSPRVDLLYSLLVGGSASRPGVRRFNLLYANVSRLARSLDLNDIFEAFDHDLHLNVAELARRRLFVHAGVVGWRERAILMPGRSHAGKSSLVAALVQAGATYYSDEYAVLDAQGRVHPYARPLSLRHGEGGKPIRYDVEQLGGRTGVKPLPIGLVVVAEYQAGAVWRPRSLSLGRGILALLANTVAVRGQPEMALDTLQHAVSGAKLIKGRRGEAAGVVPLLLTCLEG
jgi:hypothetical protein